MSIQRLLCVRQLLFWGFNVSLMLSEIVLL
jgi:hypothetical protein